MLPSTPRHPHKHTQRDGYPQAPAVRSWLAGLVLKGSCPRRNFPVVRGSWAERVLLELKKNLTSCFLLPAHLTVLPSHLDLLEESTWPRWPLGTLSI